MSGTMNKAIRETEPTKTARRTAPKEVRRTQLIEAAIDSISKRGIGGTTMSTITETAGLSLGIVNFHFTSKKKLFEETLLYLAREHHDEWLAAYNSAGLSPVEKLTAIVDAHFTPKIFTRKKLSVWFAFYGEAERRSTYRKLIEDIDSERIEISFGLCSEIAADEPSCPMPPRQIAFLLEALYDGIWLDYLAYPGNRSRQDARAHVYAFLATVFPTHFTQPDWT